MKKSIIILSAILITLSLTAFSVVKWNNSEDKKSEDPISKNIANTEPSIKKEVFTDFIYEVGPRFSPIKKSNIDKATSIDNFFSKKQIQKIESLYSLSVIEIIDDNRTDIKETGYSKTLTPAQLKLLQSFDYSTSFLIRVDYKEKNKDTGILEDSYSTPHLTVVPEKQAIYSNGKDALKTFLKENSEDARANVDPEKLKPAKLYFTVTKKGTIEHIKLDKSSNYPLVDKTMIELITKTPGTWEPAKNSKGEKIDQELVVSFGLMGC